MPEMKSLYSSWLLFFKPTLGAMTVDEKLLAFDRPENLF